MNTYGVARTTILFILLCGLFSSCGREVTPSVSIDNEGDKPPRVRYTNFDEFTVCESVSTDAAGTVRYRSLWLYTFTCAYPLMHSLTETYGKAEEAINDFVWTAPGLDTLYNKPLQIAVELDSIKVSADQPEYYILTVSFFDPKDYPLALSKTEMLPYRDYFQSKLEKLNCATKW